MKNWATACWQPADEDIEVLHPEVCVLDQEGTGGRLRGNEGETHRRKLGIPCFWPTSQACACRKVSLCGYQLAWESGLLKQGRDWLSTFRALFLARWLSHSLSHALSRSLSFPRSLSRSLFSARFLAFSLAFLLTFSLAFSLSINTFVRSVRSFDRFFRSLHSLFRFPLESDRKRSKLREIERNEQKREKTRLSDTQKRP